MTAHLVAAANARGQIGGAVHRLAGKVAFITGAGSGIGRAAAILFAKEGAKVVVADVKAPAGAETVQLIQAGGGEAIFRETDVTNEQSVEHAIGAAVAYFGGLDILYNNAGGLARGRLSRYCLGRRVLARHQGGPVRNVALL